MSDKLLTLRALQSVAVMVLTAHADMIGTKFTSNLVLVDGSFNREAVKTKKEGIKTNASTMVICFQTPIYFVHARCKSKSKDK